MLLISKRLIRKNRKKTKKQKKDLNHLLDNSSFTQDGFQDYLILHPLLIISNIYSPSYFAIFDFKSVDASKEDIKKLKHLILLLTGGKMFKRW